MSHQQCSWIGWRSRRLWNPVLALAAISFFCGGQILAKTASCPCGVCPCSPCTCGGGGGKSPPSGGDKTKPHDGGKDVAKSHHDGGKGDHHGHDKGGHGHGSIGVGVSVDLGGIGQRKPEADPFAAGGPPVAQTQEKPEKPKAKKKEHDAVTAQNDPFAKIELTGEQAKNQDKTASNR